MDPEQRAAFINAEAACAMADMLGMQAENKQRESLGLSMAFTHEDFMALQSRYTIGHNAVISFLRGE